jgi:hypothetical protein
MKPLSRHRISRHPILVAGTACGVLDISAALVVYGSFGLKPLRLLQGVGAGVLGRGAYDGGIPTAFFGLLCHFAVAFCAATVFYAASRRLRFLTEHAVLAGVAYGIAVYFFMSRVVVPLSRATAFVFSAKMMLIGIAIHILCVGLPIALGVRYGQSGRD